MCKDLSSLSQKQSEQEVWTGAVRSREPVCIHYSGPVGVGKTSTVVKTCIKQHHVRTPDFERDADENLVRDNIIQS